MSVSHGVRVSNSCTGCGVCVEICPTDVLRLVEGKAFPAYESDCQACFLCAIDCPYEAIAVKVQLGDRARQALAKINHPTRLGGSPSEVPLSPEDLRGRWVT